jgi:tRNA(Ile)-lysidine synthase
VSASRPDPAVAEVRRAVRAALAALPAGARSAPAVVACSGGADSLALAAAVAEVRRDGPPVLAAVVDHGLQEGSAAVARATAEALDALGIAAAVHPVSVHGAGGPEAAARRARYTALAAARPHPDSPVLLGHTLDDQAETVLLGLGRGSGPRSIAGMRPWDAPWCRPLLGVRRATTRAACTAQDLPVWDDPHNDDARYTRVRLRREVLPLLEDVLAGGVAAALARTAEQLRDDGDALDALAAAVLDAARTGPGRAAAREPDPSRDPASTPDPTRVAATLDPGLVAAAPPAVRRRALRAWLGECGVTGLTAVHLHAAEGVLTDGSGVASVALPGGLELIGAHGRLVLRPVGWPVAHLARGSRDGASSRTERYGTSGSRTEEAHPVYDGDIASVLVTEQAIRDKTAELAEQIARDYAGDAYAGDTDLLLVGVLKGAVMFMTDLARALPMPVQLEFMAVSSYGSATSSSGVVRILKDLDRDITGRNVLIVEDIIDSGLTLSWLLKNLESRSPASLQVCTLLRKPDAVKADVPVAYVGFDIPNEFVVGYGLDYAERYRDLPFIGTLAPAVYA